MVEIVGARTQLRKSGARWMGRCPFHEDRTPSFSVDPADKLFYCHGCGKGGDLISFVRETEGLDFVGAIEWLADRYRIPLEYEETSPQVEAGRKRKERLLALLEQAATYYGRTLWESPAGEPVRAYLGERGLAEEVCKEFRLGLSPGGVVLAQKAREKGYAQEELVASGLVNRRGNDYYAGRLVFPLADARGRDARVRCAPAARRRPDPGEVRELARERAVPQELARVRAPPRARRDREGGPRGRRRGLHGRARAPPGGPHDGRRLDGDGPHRAPAEGAPAPDAPSLPLLRRRRGGRLGDAARDGARGARGLRRARRAAPRRARPCRRRRRLRGADRHVRRLSAHRVTLEIERAPSKQDAFGKVREVLGGVEDSPERADAVRYAADRLDLPADTAAGLVPRTLARTGSVSPKLLDAGDRLERRLLAACSTSPSSSSATCGRWTTATSTTRSTGACGLIWSGTRRWRRPTSSWRARRSVRSAEEEHLDGDVARELFLRLEERLVRRELADLLRRRPRADGRAPGRARQDPRRARQGRERASLDFSGRAIPGSSIGRASGC